MGRDRDLIVRAGRDIDCSEIDVDDEFAAGRASEGLTNVFFRERGRSRRGDEEQEKSANDHRSKWVGQKICAIPLFNFHGHPVTANVSGAQLLFPITYIFGDIFTEVYGYGASRRAIWLGFFACTVLSLMGLFVVWIPAAPGWPNQAAFEAVFYTVPGFIVASLVAFWLGEFTNSYT